MTRVLVLQGPNLNLLGTREPEIYGRETLDEVHAEIAAGRSTWAWTSSFFQSNHEGALIDRLHERDFDAAIVNAGGLTHTSVSLRDALLAVDRPFWEVHLTDPSTREAFRSGELPQRRRRGVDRHRGKRGYRDPRHSMRLAERRVAAAAGLTRAPSCAACGAEIDELDRRIVALLNERAELGARRRPREDRAGRRAIRDAEREREVLLRVTMANKGPMPQADLLAIYRRLMAVTRALETRDRARAARYDGDSA